jgi:hypothetical protein
MTTAGDDAKGSFEEERRSWPHCGRGQLLRRVVRGQWD